MSTDTLDVIADVRSDAPTGSSLIIAAAQLGGPWLNPKARLARALEAAELASDRGCDVVAYPETYVSGYPFWMSRTDGAVFDNPDQKRCYAYYLDSAIEIDGPEVSEMVTAAADLRTTLVVGITERGSSLGRGSVWCTSLTIDPRAGVVIHHRKVVPTYDERLVWASGDGYGLRTHELDSGAVIGSLNCWENWMPQARAALYAQEEAVHIGLWPGSDQLTRDITRFSAMEGRSFGVAVSGVMSAHDIPDDFPLAEQLVAGSADLPFRGGSAVVGPDGEWIVAPVSDVEGLVIAELDLNRVWEARSMFDPTGHYARPDIFQDSVDRRRRATVSFNDGERSDVGSHG